MCWSFDDDLNDIIPADPKSGYDVLQVLKSRTEFAATGEYARNVEKLRKAYSERRDALLTTLYQYLDGRATWLRPSGGYFVWVTLPSDRDASALLPQAEANGISYLPGSTFFLEAGQGERSLRLAFSRYGSDELVEAVRRLGRTLT